MVLFNRIRLGSSFFLWFTLVPLLLSSSRLMGALGKRTPQVSALTEVLDDIDLHSDNRVRPGYGENPLEIHAFAFLRNIIEINEVQSTVTLSLLLMQIWEDPRLMFESPPIGNNNKKIDEILIDNPDFMSRIWNPDTFIVNEVNTHSCPTSSSSQQPSLANQVIKLSSGGNVLKTSRLTVTVSCPMQLQNYPFHAFQCDIELESFGHKTKDLVFIWRNGSRSIDHSKVDATLLATKTSYSLIDVDAYSQQNHLDTGGSYSKLIIRLKFQKLWMRHLITFFIPTMVLTIGSLLTLWLLDCHCCPKRNNGCAGIGVVANFIIAGFIVLLSCLEYSTTPVLAQLPVLTPVDFQAGICLSTVFSAIAYHGLSMCCSRKSRRRNNNNGSSSPCLCSCSCCCCCCSTPSSRTSKHEQSLAVKGQDNGDDRTATSQTSGHARSKKVYQTDGDSSTTYTKVTCYDSYDNATDNDDDDDGECEGGSASSSRSSNNIKSLPTPRVNESSSSNCVKTTGLGVWRSFLYLSKCFSTVSFVLAEVLLGYTFWGSTA